MELSRNLMRSPLSHSLGSGSNGAEELLMIIIVDEEYECYQFDQQAGR